MSSRASPGYESASVNQRSVFVVSANQNIWNCLTAQTHLGHESMFLGQTEQTSFLGSVVGFKVLNSNVTQCSDVTLATGAATAVVWRRLLVRMGTTSQVCS